MVQRHDTHEPVATQLLWRPGKAAWRRQHGNVGLCHFLDIQQCVRNTSCCTHSTHAHSHVLARTSATCQPNSCTTAAPVLKCCKRDASSPLLWEGCTSRHSGLDKHTVHAALCKNTINSTPTNSAGTHACVRCRVDVMMSSPSLLNRFFSCARQCMTLTLARPQAAWKVRELAVWCTRMMQCEQLTATYRSLHCLLHVVRDPGSLGQDKPHVHLGVDLVHILATSPTGPGELDLHVIYAPFRIIYRVF
jgi:hypothetical protein